jgi:uncharacterized short protein YbdD (DUF466 family)
MLRSNRWRVEAVPTLMGRAAWSLPARVVCTAAAWVLTGWRIAAQTARLAVGIPDYDAYVEHLHERHPGHAPMDRDAFFRDRMQARYGRGRSRCC